MRGSIITLKQSHAAQRIQHDGASPRVVKFPKDSQALLISVARQSGLAQHVGRVAQIAERDGLEPAVTYLAR